MRRYMGFDIPDTFAERAGASRSALVVVDMQNDFVAPDGHCGRFLDVSGFSRVTEPIARLAAAARTAGVPVFYTQQVQRPDGGFASPVWLADNLRVLEPLGKEFEPRHCMEGTWGAQVVDGLAPGPDDVVVPKTRRTAFEGTNLAAMLRARGRSTIVATGVAATGCVESTVRDAIEKDFFVVVARDCIGDATEDRLAAAHETFSHLLQPGDLTDAKALVDLWGDGGGA